ncbi:hypothetical protein K504DRAFT_461301 [Pleomassaria siparia CBS 279.74]|uniref:CFEM domain-containing protein n=1 Tax=Pleomassaria siparia CBS 279.74 TaxID=1314801 RepID=A0A6G1JVG8_9PLEO|nr:hypothetical protein K504DRAFT_461301 [Pleomassaria siparia CBS 279.74]
MKTFTVTAFAALAAVASAQLDNIPGCALSCFLTPLGSDGCDFSDFACHCKGATALFASVVPCVQKACSASDQAATISAVESTCAAAGVPVQVPVASSAPPATTAAPKSTSSAPAATSEAPVSTSKAPVSTSEAPVATSEAPVPSSSAIVSSHPTASSNGTLPSSVAPTESQFTGGAARHTQAAGILGAAAVAFFAL